MDLSYDLRKGVRDCFHFYEQMDYDDDTSSTMSVDDLTYSTLINDEVVDNGERHAGLKPCDTGLETCDELKPTRHGKELLNNSIQSAIERGDSGIDNLTYLSGDDTNVTSTVFESKDDRTQMTKVVIYNYILYYIQKTIHSKHICKNVHS